MRRFPMQRDKHNLADDFPQFQEKIQALKQTDDRFRTLAKEYHEIDHQVRGLEMQGVPTGDVHFEDLKKKRLQLKDSIYTRLNQA